MDAANATLQNLRKMNLSGSSGSGDVHVRPSTVDTGSAEAAKQAPDATMPAQVLPEGSAAAQQPPAAPLDPQAVRVGRSVVNSPGSEPAAGNIVVGHSAPADKHADDAGFHVGHSVVNRRGPEPSAGEIVIGNDAAADEDAGNAGYPAQPRASAGVTTGFGGSFGCQILFQRRGLLLLPSAALLSAVWLQQALQKPIALLSALAGCVQAGILAACQQHVFSQQHLVRKPEAANGGVAMLTCFIHSDGGKIKHMSCQLAVRHAGRCQRRSAFVGDISAQDS